MSDQERIGRQRSELRRQFKALYQQVTRILFEEDPIGINFKSNTDEYEPETGTILPRLRECRTVDDVRNVVHEEVRALVRRRYCRLTWEIYFYCQENLGGDPGAASRLKRHPVSAVGVGTSSQQVQHFSRATEHCTGDTWSDARSNFTTPSCYSCVVRDLT